MQQFFYVAFIIAVQSQGLNRLDGGISQEPATGTEDHENHEPELRN